MQERRSAHRYRLPLPVAIKRVLASKQFDTLCGRVTDISIDGLCFTSQEHFTVGDKFEFSVILPTEGIHVADAEVFVVAQAMVVRVEQKPANANQRSCVAAVIEAFKIIRTKESAS
jgi:hypothetical protein